MRIYTSCFAKISDFVRYGFVPVSITFKPPLGYDGLSYLPLAPERRWVDNYKATGDAERYRSNIWYAMLHQLSYKEVYSDLCTITDNQHTILVGHESPEDALLLWVIAEWFNTRHTKLHTGVVDEWDGALL